MTAKKSFDFKKAKAEAKLPQQIRPMKAIILGTSGGGKSSLLGTSGLDLVMFYGKTEEHGPTAAKTLSNDHGGSITAIEYTVWKEENGISILDPDASINNLKALLRDVEVGNEFQAVAIDSLTELQSIYLQTRELADGCKTDKGVHNKWAEGDVFVKFFEEVRDALITLQGKGLHCFVTCAALKSPAQNDNNVVTYEPNLRGFKVAENIIRMFDDVLLVDRTENEETEEITHRLIFKANVTKKSKDLRGNVTKSLNFQPRVAGFKVQDLPETADAILDKIITGRQKAFSKTK